MTLKKNNYYYLKVLKLVLFIDPFDVYKFEWLKNNKRVRLFLITF